MRHAGATSVGLGLLLLLGLSMPSLTTATCLPPDGDKTPYDIWRRLPSAVQDKTCDEAKQAAEARKREEVSARAAAEKAELHRAERARDARIEETQNKADRQRAAECAQQGACPSSAQDVRDQLNRGSR